MIQASSETWLRRIRELNLIIADPATLDTLHRCKLAYEKGEAPEPVDKAVLEELYITFLDDIDMIDEDMAEGDDDDDADEG